MDRTTVAGYSRLNNEIVASVLELSKKHQKGRATSDVANATFDFTEGWFRTSGLYDLFDTLDTIAMLKEDGLTQAEIGEVIGVSRSSIKDHQKINKSIGADVLELCKVHQAGRAPKDGANAPNVAFDFTEGWFRTSGLYDLFDTLDTIAMLKSDGLTQAEIGDVIGVSRGAVNQYSVLINKIVTDVLELCKSHQEGRVTKEVTNVTFNFTEGWFRTSQLHTKYRQGIVLRVAAFHMIPKIDIG